MEEKEKIKVSIMGKNRSKKNGERGKKKIKRNMRNLGKRKIKKGKKRKRNRKQRKTTNKKTRVKKKMARNSECQGRVRREAVCKYTPRKKRKKKKKTFNVHEEGKLGLVDSGSGGGPRKKTAPVVTVEGCEKWKSKSKKRMNVGDVEVLLKVAKNCKLTGIQ